MLYNILVREPNFILRIVSFPYLGTKFRTFHNRFNLTFLLTIAEIAFSIGFGNNKRALLRFDIEPAKDKEGYKSLETSLKLF